MARSNKHPSHRRGAEPKRIQLPTAAVPAVVVVAAMFVLASILVGSGHAVSSPHPEWRGVQLHSLWSDSSRRNMDRELDLARDLGSNVVRLDVVWGSLETKGKGRYSAWYVKKLDRFMRGADARGIKVLVDLWSSPCWASSAPSTLKRECRGEWWARGVGDYPPKRVRDYAHVARWMTSRYGSRLAALEVWNEPNLADPGNSWRTNDKAAAYAALLKAAYPAAKAGNRRVPVLAGALSFADRRFLRALYARGVKGFYDGISVHPYNEWRDPRDRWRKRWEQYTFLPGIESLRRTQLAAGDRAPLWITEFGWQTGYRSTSGWAVTEAQQAEYLVEAFKLLEGLDYVKAAVIYNLRNKGSDPADHEANFGLVRRNYLVKPAFKAVRSYLRRSPGAGR